MMKNLTNLMLIGFFLTAAGVLTVFAQTEADKPAGDAFTSTAADGSVMKVFTSNPGKLHSRFSFTVMTADYYRGLFDGVPEGLDDLAYLTVMALTAELWEGTSIIRELSLTVGTQNGFSNEEPFEVECLDVWYESNTYIGLTVLLFYDFLVGTTLTLYTSPNDILPTFAEAIFTLNYHGNNYFGRLNPTLLLALPVYNRQGFNLAIGVNPEFTLFDSDYLTFSLAVPLTFSLGFSGYYLANNRTDGYIELGIYSRTGLAFIPDDYGVWTLSAGLDFLFREQELVTASHLLDNADNIVLNGVVALSFVY